MLGPLKMRDFDRLTSPAFRMCDLRIAIIFLPEYRGSSSLAVAHQQALHATKTSLPPWIMTIRSVYYSTHQVWRGFFFACRSKAPTDTLTFPEYAALVWR